MNSSVSAVQEKAVRSGKCKDVDGAKILKLM
jgi:hypothetical protein